MLTRDEAARSARLSLPTLDAAIRAGDVSVARVGRRVLVHPDSLAAWLAARTTPAKKPQREAARAPRAVART